jgi:hypothetical protein
LFTRSTYGDRRPELLLEPLERSELPELRLPEELPEEPPLREPPDEDGGL